MYKKQYALLAIFSAAFFVNSAGQQPPFSKKLVEYGWDYPTVDQLKSNLPAMEKAPFDGVCFSIDKNILAAFDNTPDPDSRFQFDKLPGIPWSKFTDNFLIVRGAPASGAHWLDDQSWDIISQNLKKISKAVSLTGAVGIGFDAEYYFKDSTRNPWVYRPEYYNNLSYDAVGEYVRKRGQQFMQALQAYKPDIKVLCFWLLGWTWDQHKTRPVEKTTMALYPFFIEGMLEGQNGSSAIIDGNESSYWYQSFIPFVTVGTYIRGVEASLLDARYRDQYSRISVAESVFVDGLLGMAPAYNRGLDSRTKSGWFRDNLYFAYKTTDQYVWLYDERVNWWDNRVDPSVRDIIDQVRKEMADDAKSAGNDSKGESAVPDYKAGQNSSYHGFSYTYDQPQHRLEITLLADGITSIQVFDNSRPIYTLQSPPNHFTVDLAKLYHSGGNLIIVSKNGKGAMSVAFVN